MRTGRRKKIILLTNKGFCEIIAAFSHSSVRKPRLTSFNFLLLFISTAPFPQVFFLLSLPGFLHQSNIHPNRQHLPSHPCSSKSVVVKQLSRKKCNSAPSSPSSAHCPQLMSCIARSGQLPPAEINTCTIELLLKPDLLQPPLVGCYAETQTPNV